MNDNMSCVGWAMLAFAWGVIARNMVHGRLDHLWIVIFLMVILGFILITAGILTRYGRGHLQKPDRRGGSG